MARQATIDDARISAIRTPVSQATINDLKMQRQANDKALSTTMTPTQQAEPLTGFGMQPTRKSNYLDWFFD